MKIRLNLLEKLRSVHAARTPEDFAALQARWLSLGSCLALSLAFWVTFYPTVYSRDALYVLLDAAHASFSDMHPLLIPVLLSLILKMGANISLVTFAQLFLGFLGILRLVRALERFLGGRDPRTGTWIGLVVLLILASPLTPLSIYLATVWSDTWLSILLLWSLALLLELVDHPIENRMPVPKIAVLVLLLALMILVRYNAIVICLILVYPFVGTLRRRHVPMAQSLGLAVLPLLLAVSFLGLVYRLNKIRPLRPERAVYALDLASMILYDPSICQNLSLHSCDLVLGEFSAGFKVGGGAIDLTLNQANDFQYAPFMELFAFPRLESEFVTAASQHPGLLFTVKLMNFLDYLRPDLHRFFFQTRLFPSDIADMPGQAFTSPDGPWFLLARQILWNPVLSWFSYVHAIWLLVNIAALLGVGIWARRSRDGRMIFLWKLLLAPAACYAVYLIALTTSEFRFMYPGTLTMQVITLTFAASLVARRRTGCAPADQI